MKAVHWIIIVVLLGVAVFLVVHFDKKFVGNNPDVSPTPTPLPMFSTSGEVMEISSSQIAISYVKYIDVNGQQSSVHDRLSAPIMETTPIFRLQKSLIGEGYTEVPAKVKDIKVGMQVVLYLTSENPIALFPLKIDILPLVTPAK